VYKVIEGNSKLFKYKGGKVRKANAFFGPAFEMDEVEFWEDRLTKLGIEYCLVFHPETGYTIFCDSVSFVDNVA
jgi:hypothetical protein